MPLYVFDRRVNAGHCSMIVVVDYLQLRLNL